MSIDIATLEKTALNIVQGIIDHEGLINTIASAVGILPQVSLAEKALPYIAGVLQFMQQETGKSLLEVFQDFMNHNVPNMPNSPVLTPATGDDPRQASTT